MRAHRGARSSDYSSGGGGQYATIVVVNGRPIAVVPARNEEPRIGAVLMTLRAMLPDLDIVVVDDASVDDTAAAARASGARVVRHPVHLGYGAGLKTGYTYALRHGHP